jgi:serine/threonine protein kinase
LALQHPNILPLLDSGEAAGLFYYAMPYVEGQSLRERRAREGALPVPDTVRILRDLVDALTEAHAHGVVHRDIKPENILLRGRHALVTDFGVAKAVSEATGRPVFMGTTPQMVLSAHVTEAPAPITSPPRSGGVPRSSGAATGSRARRTSPSATVAARGRESRLRPWLFPSTVGRSFAPSRWP